MSREQWGHGYWRGVEDAQAGKVRGNFPTEVKFWIANMCISNYYKSYDSSLFPVSEWVAYANCCGLSTAYAKKVYDYILRHDFYDFKPNEQSWCYVTGSAQSKWTDDYFVIPLSNYELQEWETMADNMKKIFCGRLQ